MTYLQDTIREVLEETGGNVSATALRLGVSNEYVRQLAPTTPVGASPLAAPLPPAVKKLTDTTIQALQTYASSEFASAEILARLLRILLDYDIRLQTISRPLMSVDNRTQVLIGNLDQLSTEELKILARARREEMALSGEILDA